MKRLSILLGVLILSWASYAQSLSDLNTLLSTYAHNIKTNNPYANTSTYSSCIYNTKYIYAEQQGKTLTFSFGFAWDERYGYIYKDLLKIDMSSADFKICGNDNNEIIIKDKEGMILISTGQQKYNQGTKQDLISEIRFNFGTEPVANRVFKEISLIQEQYKPQKEPEVLPKETQQRIQGNSSVHKTISSQSKRTQSTKGRNKNNTPIKKVGKYVQ